MGNDGFSYKSEIRLLICWKGSPLPIGELLCREMETCPNQEKDNRKLGGKGEFHKLRI